MRSLELLFWGSLGLTLWAYGIYPLVVWRFSRRVSKSAACREPAKNANRQPKLTLPKITLLLAADRAEDVIVRWLQNALEVDYPANRFEILIGCDGEDDLTGFHARSCTDQRVHVVRFPTRRGQASVINDCVRQSAGEIIVFSDAGFMLRSDSIRRIAKHFAGDPRVGGVWGNVVPVDSSTGRPIGGFLASVENLLKHHEIRLGGLPDKDTGLYAVRKTLFVPFPENSRADECLLALGVRRQGYRSVYEEPAVAVIRTPPSVEATLPRRLLNTAWGIKSLLVLLPHLSLRNGPGAVVFWVHKLLRRMCPALLIVALVSNACLSFEPFYLHCLLIHELVYLLVLAGLFLTSVDRWPLSRRQKSLSPAVENDRAPFDATASSDCERELDHRPARSIRRRRPQAEPPEAVGVGGPSR